MTTQNHSSEQTNSSDKESSQKLLLSGDSDLQRGAITQIGTINNVVYVKAGLTDEQACADQANAPSLEEKNARVINDMDASVGRMINGFEALEKAYEGINHTIALLKAKYGLETDDPGQTNDNPSATEQPTENTDDAENQDE